MIGRGFSNKSRPPTNPVKTSCKKYASFAIIFLARSCTKSCTYLASLALKMKLFLQDTKNLARILQEKL